MRGDCGVAGEDRLVGEIPGVSAPYAINEYQLRLDAQCILWPVYYIIDLHYIFILRGSFKLHLGV